MHGRNAVIGWVCAIALGAIIWNLLYMSFVGWYRWLS